VRLCNALIRCPYTPQIVLCTVTSSQQVDVHKIISKLCSYMVLRSQSMIELILNKMQVLQPYTITYTPPLSHNPHLPSPLSHHPNLPLSSLPPPLGNPLLYPTIITFPSKLSHHYYLPTPFPFLSLCPALLCFFVLSPVVLCCAFLYFVMLCLAVPCFVICLFCRVLLACMCWRVCSVALCWRVCASSPPTG
jgi:hypothetical protein